VESIIKALQWFFGWMPKTQIKKIGHLRARFNVGKEPDSDDDDDIKDEERGNASVNEITAVDSSTANLKEGGRR
jgi:hypothetical protein